MAVSLTTPVTTPATPATTYNEVWFRNIQVVAPSPSQPVVVTVNAVPYDGTTNILNTNRISFQIPDLFAASDYTNTTLSSNVSAAYSGATPRQLLAVATEAIFAALQAYGQSNGKF
jgi:hypothetical protein